jgi:2-oxoglutarate ferredoxin oxidoreductase subunit beta
MSFIKKPSVHHPKLPTNALGLNRRDYEGALSTLCAGCGHDSVSSAIIEACYNLSIPAHKLAKLSGIGCSSKTPTYFLNKSHGFNSVHGRMPSVATGANLANRDLVYLGVSGDGDTASIGLGQFCHIIRRRLNMLYVVDNNGTYGLTKGQFSATNDKNSKSKKGEDNPFESIDLAALAIQLGAGFVARSFSGDKDQLIPLITAALKYRGFAFIDVVSPCVTFNNHSQSTKSYEYFREHNEALGYLDVIPETEEIKVNYKEGSSAQVQMHDGSKMILHKLDKSHNLYDRGNSIKILNDHQTKGSIVTGLIYLDKEERDLHDTINSNQKPLNILTEKDLCPGSKGLDYVNASFR